MFRQTLFSPHRVILAGAAIAMLFTAFTQGILIMNETDLQGLLFWLSGLFHYVTFGISHGLFRLY